MMYNVNVIELKKKMIDKNINTIDKLSELSNVNRNTLGAILNKKSLPSSMVMYALAETLELSSSECGYIFFDH